MIRFCSMALLVGSFFLSVVFMLVGISVEGMRHTGPPVNPYFIFGIPVGYFGLLLIVSSRYLPTLAAVILSMLAGVMAAAWPRWQFHTVPDGSEGVVFSVVVALLLALGMAAAWQIRKPACPNRQ